jgi:hypothetical protein
LVEVREGTKVVASIRPGKPCRATIGPTEMIIGGPPLISQLGDTRWTGAESPSGTTLAREGDPVVRIKGDLATLSVFGADGIATLVVHTTPAGANVTDATARLMRTLEVKSDQIVADHPPLVVTGTHDVLLASLLTAPELAPEVRMLAACERVLVTEKKEL